MGDIKLVTSTQISKPGLTLVRSSLRSEPPAFTLPPRNARVSQGGTVCFEGKVRGSPEPQVRWHKDGKPLTPGDRHTMEQSPRGGFSLVVRAVREDDAGRYTCEAVNEAGSRQVTVELTVEGNTEKRFNLPSSTRTAGGRVPAVDTKPSIWGESPPKFVTKPSRLYLRVGQSGKFSAKITGRPQPQVLWLKGEAELPASGRFSTYEKLGVHFLEITDARVEDAGRYTCSVVNCAGKATATAELTVQGSSTEGDASRLVASVAPMPKKTDLVTVKQTSGSLVTDEMPSRMAEKKETRATHSTTSAEVVTGAHDEGPKTDTQSKKTPSEPRVSSHRRPGSDSRVGSSGPGCKFGQTGGAIEREALETTSLEPTREVQGFGRESGFEQTGTPPHFDFQPQSQEVLEGAKVTFRCQVSGAPVPTLSWIKDGMVLRGGSGFQMQQDGGLHLLCLERVRKEDGGNYGCAATNSKGQASATWMLSVKKRKTSEVPKPMKATEVKKPLAPGFLKGLEDLKVMDGSRVCMTVKVVGYPEPQVAWLHNGQEVQESEDFHFEQKGSEHSLVILEVFPEDTGKYTCEAWNELGGAHSEAILTVQEPQDGVQPWFITKPKSMTASLGQHALLSCAIAGDPFPEFQWKKDGRVLSSGMDYEVLQKEDVVSLLIRRVKAHHAGVYEISLKNKVGDCSSIARVLVNEESAGFTESGAGPSQVGVGQGAGGVASPERGGGSEREERERESGESVDTRGLLKRRVETRQHGEEHVRQQEAEQHDFRAVLGRKVNTKSLSEEDLKEITGEQMDFRANLQRQVKPKTLSEDERKISSPQQVDFRSVLGKKGGSGPKPTEPSKAEPAKNATSDFRSVLGGKKKPATIENQMENAAHKEIAPKGMPAKEKLAAVENNVENAAPKGKLPMKKPAAVENNTENMAPKGTEPKGTLPIKKSAAVEKNTENMAPKGTEPKGTLPIKKPAAVENNTENMAPKCMELKGAVPMKKPVAIENSSENAALKSTEPKGILPMKKPAAVEKITENLAPKSTEPKGTPPEEKPKNDINCMEEGISEKKNSGVGTAPVFTQPLSDVNVLDGEVLRLECQVTANPPATITWTLDGKVIKPSKFIVLSQEGDQCSLTIEKALPEDEGQYKCQAENAAGRVECSCMVLVDDPSDRSMTPADKRTKKAAPTTENEARIKKKPAPKTPPKQAVPLQIIQFPEDMKILAGEKVDLLCKFGGAPPITCTWLKFRKPIQEGKNDMTIETTESTSQLTISPTKPDHCGCYTIELQNKAGTRQASVNLTIVDKPDPPARVPAASDIRKSSLTLSWYGPTYDGGSVVQSYNLEIWNSMDKEWKPLASCNSTSFNVQDLLADREYKFRVRAVNIYGIGEPSAESEPVTVGEEEGEKKKVEEEEEAEASDEDAETVPEYRDVVIKNDQTVKDFYDVEERLGTGKFGQVFRLVEKSTKKVWAGKFIKAYSAKDKAGVRQEIGIMNDLHHPKLVQCVDAFEGKSDIVMVMEMISGGELFERIIDEDFELTEREVIKYMLQIIDGVSFIHKQGIVHLDLKPENIMCVNKTGSKIKLIDFGLARRLENSESLKVLFGTPEFVAPEVINYEPIGYQTDMWSIGVICYILVSGLSPFMGDDDNETLSNVTSATWDFEDEAFDEISEEAKDFISKLLKKNLKARLTCPQCLDHPWLKQDTKNMEAKKLSKERMKKYLLRRKWQKTGHAVRAIGRLSSMAMMSGISARKGGSPTGNPTEDDPAKQLLECTEDEERPHMKPFFCTVIKDVEVVEGSAARFDCKIEGYPDPEVVWYKDDQPIKETRHFQIDYDEEGNCSLVISEVSSDDDAKYTCKAVNSLGEAMCTADLLVEFMTEEEGEDAGEEAEEEKEV